MKDIIKLNNTLEELKTVADSLDTTDTEMKAVLDSIDTTLDTVKTVLDTIEAKTNARDKSVDTIIGEFAVTDTATSKTIGGKLCTVNVLSGQIWINPNATAVADATSIKLTGSIDLVVDGDLSLISDADGANVQIIVWS